MKTIILVILILLHKLMLDQIYLFDPNTFFMYSNQTMNWAMSIIMGFLYLIGFKLIRNEYK
jgi:hypothetical protein